MSLLTHPSHQHTHSIPAPRPPSDLNIWQPLRRWIDQISVTNRRAAHLICRVIPCCCPFERDLTLFGHTVHIPALCELNPVYNELVGLRFRALSYLADACGEDINRYIC
ncbi:MAG: Mo-dependent nitrogenase C-terminal domain-containing protein [Nodosilinea sp.]